MTPASARVDVALIVAAVVLVRAATFWSQVDDWDVGLYLVVAREVLHGHLPYVTAWEYRPPGIFLLLAGALWTFKAPATAMAVLGTTCASLACLALYAIGRLFGRTGRTVGAVAALLYATLSAEDDGLATNAEILIAPFLCWAVFLVSRAAVLRKGIGVAHALAIGLLLGGALQMKLTVLGEAAFVIVLAAVWVRGAVRWCGLIAGVTVLPFALEAAVYAAQGHLSAFLDANALATVRRIGVGTSAPKDNLQHILAQPRTLAPAWLLPFVIPFALRRRRIEPAPAGFLAALCAWLVVEVLTILAVREFNEHQFLQLMPPLVLLSGYATAGLGAWWLRSPRIAAAVVVLLSFGMHGYYQVVTAARLAYHRTVLRDAAWRAGHLDRVADALRRIPPERRSLFVFSENAILYVLADAPLPTRYPFSFYLTDAEMWPLTGVDGRQEVARILSGKPTVIVRSDSRFHVDPAVAALVASALAKHYRRVARFPHDAVFTHR